jgi:putative membrane protein
LTYLVETFLPLSDQAGKAFPRKMFSQVMEELKRKFGRVTVYDRSPAKGKTDTSSDDIVIFEVMTDDGPRVVVLLPGEARSEIGARRSPYPRCQYRKVIGRPKLLVGREPTLQTAFLRRRIMSVKTSVALMLALASTAASAQSTMEKTGVNSALGVAPKTHDFVTEAAVSDMTEIATAKIALQKGDADEKQFADQMVKDHTQTSAELKALVSSGDVQATLPTAPDSTAQKQIDKLNAAAPADFRSEYDPMQVSAHKSAVSLFERYAKGGDNIKLKDWAQKTLPHLQHHLDMANMLDQRKK